MGFAVLAVLTITFKLGTTKVDENDANIMALYSSMSVAYAEAGCTTSSCGPGKVEDCAGPGTGTKKLCLSENNYNCTESGCS